MRCKKALKALFIRDFADYCIQFAEEGLSEAKRHLKLYKNCTELPVLGTFRFFRGSLKIERNPFI